jgi:hypothetical protein
MLTSPGLSQKIEVLMNPQRCSDIIELIHEQFWNPEILGNTWTVRRCSISKLVVKYDRNPYEETQVTDIG